MPTHGPDHNRRVKAAKNLMEASGAGPGVKSKRDALQKQYRLIRQDVMKLRADLARGYDLLKELVETKVSRRSLVKGK